MIVTPLTAEECRATEFTHRIEITEADLTGSGSGTLFDVVLMALIAGHVIRNLAYKLVTAFTGGSVSAITMSVGDTGTPTRYLAAGSVFTAGTTFVSNAVATQFTNITGTNLIARFTPTGDSVLNLTAGRIIILVQLVDLNKVAGDPSY